MRRPPDYVKKLRQRLTEAFPDVLFYFQPADLVTQVLNFGVPTQIDVQVQGRDRENNERIAALLQQRMATIPGIVDAHRAAGAGRAGTVLHDRPDARAGAWAEHASRSPTTSISA